MRWFMAFHAWEPVATRVVSVLVAPLGFSVGASVPLLGGNPIHDDLSVHHVAKALRSTAQTRTECEGSL